MGRQQQRQRRAKGEQELPSERIEEPLSAVDPVRQIERRKNIRDGPKRSGRTPFTTVICPVTLPSWFLARCDHNAGPPAQNDSFLRTGDTFVSPVGYVLLGLKLVLVSGVGQL
jgi:hypothetical protein